MELLLNLLWLALAIPALWLWRCPRQGRWHPGRLASALLLGSVVVLLFPTISASDDLQPMRAEVEDSSSSWRTVRQAAVDHAAPLVRGRGHLCLSPGAAYNFSLNHYHAESVILPAVLQPESASTEVEDARGPPCLRLA